MEMKRMLRVCLGGSLLLNAALASVWNDTRYEHTLASNSTIDRVLVLLEQLGEENKYLSAYKTLVEIDDPSFANLQKDHGEYYNYFADVTEELGVNMAIFHHRLSTRRTCYAFLLRNGAYGKYLSYQMDNSVNYLYNSMCRN